MSVRHDDEAAREIIEVSLGVKIFLPFIGLLLSEPGGREPSGAVIVNNYEGTSCFFTCVHNGLMSMRTARQVARYILIQLGCRRVTAITRKGNDAAISALEALGFKYEGTMREHFHDGDGLMYGLLRSEQKIVRL